MVVSGWRSNTLLPFTMKNGLFKREGAKNNMSN